MQNLKVTLWGVKYPGKYVYHTIVNDNPTIQYLAWVISLEVHKKENKTKFTNRPRLYNYIKECLLRKTAHSFRFNAENPTPDMEKQIYDAANELMNKSKPEKVGCVYCYGTGYLPYDLSEDLTGMKCPDCNGYGYRIRRQAYRVGNTFTKALVIDVDGKDEKNLVDVQTFYETLLRLKFSVFKTNGGYWLIGDKKYTNLDEWLFDHCLVLYPCLQWNEFANYKKGLLALDRKLDGEFHGATPEDIKKSKFYKGHGNFDIAFTFLSIKRERSTLRESKKHKDDKVEELTPLEKRFKICYQRNAAIESGGF